MDSIISRQNHSLTGVTRDFMIILEVQSPHVPSLDLVDLPGVVTAASANEPEDMPQQTRALVEEHIRANHQHSLFLCVVQATMAPNASTGMQMLQQLGLLDRTIGVITMCDELAVRHHPKLRARLQQQGDAVVLRPFGWVATMNCPVPGKSIANYSALLEQAGAEAPFFVEQGMSDLIDSGLATCPALVGKIDAMFLQYMKESWFPTTIRMLHDEQDKLLAGNVTLGLPATTATETAPTGAAELKQLQDVAVVAASDALSHNRQWMLDYYWRELISVRPFGSRLRLLRHN